MPNHNRRIQEQEARIQTDQQKFLNEQQAPISIGNAKAPEVTQFWRRWYKKFQKLPLHQKIVYAAGLFILAGASLALAYRFGTLLVLSLEQTKVPLENPLTESCIAEDSPSHSIFHRPAAPSALPVMIDPRKFQKITRNIFGQNAKQKTIAIEGMSQLLKSCPEPLKQRFITWLSSGLFGGIYTNQKKHKEAVREFMRALDPHSVQDIENEESRELEGPIFGQLTTIRKAGNLERFFIFINERCFDAAVPESFQTRCFAATLNHEILHVAEVVGSVPMYNETEFLTYMGDMLHGVEKDLRSNTALIEYFNTSPYQPFVWERVIHKDSIEKTFKAGVLERLLQEATPESPLQVPVRFAFPEDIDIYVINIQSHKKDGYKMLFTYAHPTQYLSEITSAWKAIRMDIFHTLSEGYFRYKGTNLRNKNSEMERYAYLASVVDYRFIEIVFPKLYEDFIQMLQEPASHQEEPNRVTLSS